MFDTAYSTYSMLTEIPAFLCLQVTLIVMGRHLYLRMRGAWGRMDALLAAALCLAAWITVLQTVLGLLHLLRIESLLIAQMSALLFLWIGMKR